MPKPRSKSTTGGAREARDNLVSKKRAPLAEHLQQGRSQVAALRDLIALKLAHRLHELGWTQEEAARHLGVSQPRISDLLRVQTHKFTLDTLVEWLVALGETIDLSLTSADQERTAAGGGGRGGQAGAGDIIAYYSRVISINPADAHLYLLRGNCYLDGLQFQLAIGDFTRAFELDAASPLALSRRCHAYRQSGELKSALQDCEKMARLYPTYSPAYAQRAEIFVLLGRNSEALAQLTRAIAIEPLPQYLLERAGIHAALRQYGDAFVDYGRALQIDPNFEPARVASRALRQEISSSSD
jgi:tetratricopeptide (TPR) repeat protein